MLIVISLKNIEKMFFITKCSYVDFKMGSKVIKCNNGSFFTNFVSFFFSGPTTRCFLNSKKDRSLSEGLNYYVYHYRNPFGSFILWILQRQTS